LIWILVLSVLRPGQAEKKDFSVPINLSLLMYKGPNPHRLGWDFQISNIQNYSSSESLLLFLLTYRARTYFRGRLILVEHRTREPSSLDIFIHYLGDFVSPIQHLVRASIFLDPPWHVCEAPAIVIGWVHVNLVQGKEGEV
jgi:hypothetical protein